MLPPIVKHPPLKILAVISLLLFAATPSLSADFDKGLTAYQKGDYVTAEFEWRTLAILGDADAQYNLGLMYENGKGVLQNDKTAVKWYRLAAKQGDADAQYNLGLMYENGKGVLQNDKTAVKWYRLAAKQGDADAQYNLGRGSGVVFDNKAAAIKRDKAAVKGYRLAAEQGHVGAQYELGRMYARGNRIINKDAKAAVKWYSLAAEQGHAYAQYSLGLMYYDEGYGIIGGHIGRRDIPQNYTAAVKWFTLAAEQGHAYAQYNLGLMYRRGKGVPQDNVIAHTWMNIAGYNGNEKASEDRKILKNLMNATQIAAAQALASKCLESNYKNCTP